MVAKYLLVWLILAVVAISNGILRQFTYGKSLPELTSHQISTFTAIMASGVVVWIVNRRWPIQSSAQAWAIGTCWLLLTVLFEFGFGHFIAGHTWEKLFADYNVYDGRIWSLFLIWVFVMPFVIHKVSSRAA